MIINFAYAQSCRGKWRTRAFSSITTINFNFCSFLLSLIRPQQKKVKQHKEMVNSLKVGSSVVTSGGIVGKVVKLNDDIFITVNISNNVDVKIKRDTIVELLENSNQKN